MYFKIGLIKQFGMLVFTVFEAQTKKSSDLVIEFLIIVFYLASRVILRGLNQISIVQTNLTIKIVDNIQLFFSVTTSLLN